MTKIYNILAILAIVLVTFFYWQNVGDVDEVNTIPNATTTPITLISPNGGEQINASSTYMVKWQTVEEYKDYAISVHIRKATTTGEEVGQEFDPIIFVGLENDGNEEWFVQDMYPAGEYILEIIAYSDIPLVEGNSVSDKSNLSFEIIPLK